MKRTQVISIFVCLFGWITAETAYFSGRSSDLVLKPIEQRDTSFVAFLNRYKATSSQQTLEETCLADYISYALGGPVINPNVYENAAFKKALPQGNIFDKDVANLLVVFDSLGSDIVDPKELKMLQAASINNLVRDNYPSDTITTLASLFSGYPSSSHGIVSQKWSPRKGIEVEAYKSVEGIPAIENIGDAYTINYEGQNLVFSVSSDFQYVSAVSVNQFVQGDRNHWKNYGFYFDEFNSRMESIYGAEDFRLMNMLKSAMDIAQSIIAQPFTLPSNSDSLQFNGETLVTVTLNSKNIVAEYDISVPEVSRFFIEVEMVRTMLAEMRSNANIQASINDNIPDLFSVAFSSLKGIQKVYGKDSAQLKACICIIDELIASAIQEISTMYGGKLSVELVFLGESAVEQIQSNQEMKTSFFHRYSSVLLNHGVNQDQLDESFPYVYLTFKDYENRNEICSVFQSSSDYEVICNEDFEMMTYVDTFERQTNGTVVTVDAPIYQICLWTAVVLILAVIAAVYALYNMDIGADSMIYRMTNIKHAHLN